MQELEQNEDAAPTEAQRQQSYDAFLVWFLELEGASMAFGVGSRRYVDDWMDCYARSTRFSSGALGKQALNFANIQVDPDRQGQGYLAGLLAFLEQNRGRLAATTHFYFENVANPRLEAWLVRNGFTCVSGEPSQVGSFCRPIRTAQT